MPFELVESSGIRADEYDDSHTSSDTESQSGFLSSNASAFVTLPLLPIQPSFGVGVRRRRRTSGTSFRFQKCLKRLARYPFVPRHSITILSIIPLLTTFAVLLTLLLMYILNPDKEPLPWRIYCSVPSISKRPPGMTSSHSLYSAHSHNSSALRVTFPPPDFDSLSPAGLFVGVFSMDSAFERRMLIRSTWASHPRSRNGAGSGDQGRGTSRTILRFILGLPRKSWERRIALEMHMYNDIVILPITENMNTGKTHTYFTWASESAWVPPIYFNTTKPPPIFSYSNVTAPVPPLAPHDPQPAWDNDHVEESPVSWVRPDYVVKVDDDSFVLLAELEARLRVELHADTRGQGWDSIQSQDTDLAWPSAHSTSFRTRPGSSPHVIHAPPWPSNDPLIYWGYLVKRRFMAGELYALSWSLVDWVAKDPIIKGLTKGAEDKQTAKWMWLHPQAHDVRWVSESCWIYDHPRAGTVYSHGFLFPSEVTRIKRSFLPWLGEAPQDTPTPTSSLAGETTPTPAAWARSSVSTFGLRYTPPLPDLNTLYSVEALVEGSNMSLIREGSSITPEHAWRHREGRRARYEGKRLGGTVIVHFIKKNMWFLETAQALLGGEEYSEAELVLQNSTIDGGTETVP